MINKIISLLRTNKRPSDFFIPRHFIVVFNMLQYHVSNVFLKSWIGCHQKILNEAKHQLTIFSDNYFEWKLLLFLATVTKLVNKILKIKAGLTASSQVAFPKDLRMWGISFTLAGKISTLEGLDNVEKSSKCFQLVVFSRWPKPMSPWLTFRNVLFKWAISLVGHFTEEYSSLALIGVT